MRYIGGDRLLRRLLVFGMIRSVQYAVVDDGLHRSPAFLGVLVLAVLAMLLFGAALVVVVDYRILLLAMAAGTVLAAAHLMRGAGGEEAAAGSAALPGALDAHGSGTGVGIAQGTDHAPQDPERGRLLGPGQPGQHPELDGADRHGRLLQAPPTAGREPCGQNLADRRRGGSGHVAVPFQGLEQYVHRLPGDEGAARELGVRQARALGQQFEAGVVRHGHPERAQHLLHGGAQGARSLFQKVAQ
jgi:hypothetical protein